MAISLQGSDPGYLRIDRVNVIVIVHVSFATGRTEDAKRALHAKIAADIAKRTGTGRSATALRSISTSRARSGDDAIKAPRWWRGSHAPGGREGSANGGQSG